MDHYCKVVQASAFAGSPPPRSCCSPSGVALSPRSDRRASVMPQTSLRWRTWIRIWTETRSPPPKIRPGPASADASPRLGHDQPVLDLGGPVGGAGTPAGCRAPHPGHGLSHRSFQSVEQRLLQRPAGQEHAGLSRPALPGYVPDHHLHLPCCVPGLPQPDARDPLATLVDRPLSARVAVRWRVLPHAAPGERGRQPRPAHRGRRASAGVPHARPLHRRPAGHRHPGDLRGDSLGTLRIIRRRGRRGPHPRARLHGLGGHSVRDRGHMGDRLARPSAGPAELRSTAVRGRLPIQPRALPRKYRGRGPLPR